MQKLLMLAKPASTTATCWKAWAAPAAASARRHHRDPTRTAVALNKYVKEAPFQDPEQSPFMTSIHVLKDDPDFEV